MQQFFRKLPSFLFPICSGVCLLFLFFSVLSPILPAFAQSNLKDLDLTNIECIFPGQPGCNGPNLFDNLLAFLKALATPLAVLVVMWGGYQYYFSGITDQQSNGLKAIQAGAIGFAIVQIAPLVPQVIQSTVQSDGTFSADKITQLILGFTDGFLVPLSSVVAVAVIIWGGYKFYASSLPDQQADGKETIIKGVTGLVVVLIARPIISLVQNTIDVQNDTLNLKPDSIVSIFQNVISNILIPVSSVVTVFFVVLGAYYWITSNGDSGQVTKAQDAIKNAVIGLIIVLLCTTIVQVIIFFVGGLNLGGV